MLVVEPLIAAKVLVVVGYIELVRMLHGRDDGALWELP